jgi:hypothetical protein
VTDSLSSKDQRRLLFVMDRGLSHHVIAISVAARKLSLSAASTHLQVKANNYGHGGFPLQYGFTIIYLQESQDWHSCMDCRATLRRSQ